MTAPQDPFRPPLPPAPVLTATDGFGSALPPPDRPYGASTTAPGSTGTTVLVVGALALLLCWTVLGGLVLGSASLVLARRARGSGRATGGAVLGGLGLLAALGLVVAAVVFLRSDSGQRLRDCLDRAEGDDRAQSQCEQELRDSLAG